MKAIAILLALILLVGTLVVPIGFSEAQISELAVPNPTTSLTATAVSNTQINLSWTAPVNSTTDQVNGYKIEIKSFCSGSFSVLVANTTNTTTSYSNTGLAEGICFEYQVSALNPAGTGNASNTASATTWTLPNVPTSLNATAISQSQISLNWTAPSNTGGTQLTGYKIERRDSCTGSFSTLVANTSNTNTAYSNTGLVNGTCYEYRVFAHNAVGTSLASNSAIATTLQNPPPTTTTPPSAPTGLGVIALSKTALKLAWIASSNTGGAPILGYQIQRNGTIFVNNTGSTQTNYTNSGLLPAHQQTYRVAAWNNVGLGPYSNNATGTTKNQTGIIPTDIGNLGQQVSSFVHQFNDLLKQQREETIKKIKECNERIRNATHENRPQIKADCKAELNAIREQYKDARKQFKEDFKVFRDAAKSLIKVAKENKTIDKEDAKEFKKELKSFEKETKKAKKEFKEDIKEIKKEIKHEEKQFKKELKELKKEEKEHKKELKKEAKKAKKDKHDDDDEEDD